MGPVALTNRKETNDTCVNLRQVQGLIELVSRWMVARHPDRQRLEVPQLVAVDAMPAPPDAPSAGLRLLQWCALAGSIAALVYLWQRTSMAEAARQTAELGRIQVERQLAQARLQSLRQQIERHFMFNTLATVRRLQHTGDQGARLLEHIIAYLRAARPSDGDSADAAAAADDTLGRELELVRAYWASSKCAWAAASRSLTESKMDCRTARSRC
jgi:hypothetical protein